ncbi:hypothetical protein MKX08_000171 [Trichoderma sp. CBMAI-0020]|nr:hypothetical protein MKX08_000171 [Trichoderma sp. CBMAI-0020]
MSYERIDFKDVDYYAFRIYMDLPEPGTKDEDMEKQTPMPSEKEEDQSMWFESNANRLVKETVEKWEQGSDLESLILILTCEDIFSSRRDREVIEFVKAKIEKASKIMKRPGTNRQTPKIQPLPVKGHKKDDLERKQKTKKTISKTGGIKLKKTKHKDD